MSGASAASSRLLAGVIRDGVRGACGDFPGVIRDGVRGARGDFREIC
jgi:hypothetical protein